MMRRLLSLIVFLCFCTNSFASIMTLGTLSRSSDSRIISSNIGLDFMMWNTPEQLRLMEWETELTSKSSQYFGWRIADANEAFAMLKAANLPVYDSRYTTPSTISFDIPWSDACYDNNSLTVCLAKDRWGANFFTTVSDIQAASLFFTGSTSGFIDPLHNGIIFYNDVNAFQNSLLDSDIGAIFTHLDSGGYINASPSGYSLTDPNSYLVRPLSNLAWRPLLVRDSDTVPDVPKVEAPSTALTVLALFGLLFFRARLKITNKPQGLCEND